MSRDPAGWYSRTTSHPDGARYAVNKDNLVFGLTRNARVEQNGFSVALFKPNVAIDAMGRVLVVAKEDFTALEELARSVSSLPDTGAFRNQWRIRHDRTDYPIDQVWVNTANGLKTVGVYGHDGETTELKTPVNGITQIPSVLNDFVAYAKEGRTGFERGTEDSEVTSKVKAILQEESSD
ncbi:hypothetical protein BDV93DRAFT_436736 [Ceratobasidium sp. AG-I]|nr:hypothetical protein BDV93DRAFT_436736 [Ceratobasidium sp. AG-I]